MLQIGLLPSLVLSLEVMDVLDGGLLQLLIVKESQILA